jgi:hypothetical protein
VNPLEYLFPQEWEYDFSPIEEKQMTQVNCQKCGKVLHEADAFPVLKYFGIDIGMKTIHFCGQASANQYYLEQLRKVQS